MAGKRLAFAGCVLAMLLRSGTAVASSDDEDDDAIPPPVLAVGAGAATSFVSLTAGAMVIARSKDRSVRNAGLLGAQTGLCFSPIIAHALVGELKRGLLFATIPFLAEVGMATLMAFNPNFIVRAPAPVQYTFFGLLSISIFGSTFGVLDAAKAGERKPAPRGLRGLQVSAILDRGLTGAMIAGSL